MPIPWVELRFSPLGETSMLSLLGDNSILSILEKSLLTLLAARSLVSLLEDLMVPQWGVRDKPDKPLGEAPPHRATQLL